MVGILTLSVRLVRDPWDSSIESMYSRAEQLSFSRRDIVRAGSIGLFGMSMLRLLVGQDSASETVSGTSGAMAKACILLFMWGGLGHQDTWDLKPDAPVEIRGEFRPLSTRVPGIQICEHFPRLAQRTGKLAIIRSMTHPNVDHLKATHCLLTGQAPPIDDDLRKDWPHIGSVLNRLGRGRGALPPFVSMRPKLDNTVPRFVEESHGQFAVWLGPSWDSMTIDVNPADPGCRVGGLVPQKGIITGRLADRRSLLQALEQKMSVPQRSTPVAAMRQHYSRAYDLLVSAVERQAFDLSREPDSVRDRYGRHAHGQSVLQARRLVERGVPLVTVYWPNDGTKNVSVYWDTHNREFVDLKNRLMPPADQAFSALLDDPSDRGMLDETLVVWTGEFGRTPKVGQRNSDAGAGRDGRDHWPNCFTSVLAGGGIRGGQVHGASNRDAAYSSWNPVHPMDLVVTLYHLLGVPAGPELRDHFNRPFVICPGKPILELFT